RVDHLLHGCEHVARARRADPQLVAVRGLAADRKAQAAELDVGLRRPGTAADHVVVRVEHFIAVAGGAADRVALAIPAACGPTADALQYPGTAVAGGHACGHGAVTGADAHEDFAARQRVLHEAARRDLDRALGLVAVVGDAAGDAAERRDVVGRSAEKIAPGAVRAVGQADQVVADRAQLGGDGLAVIVRERVGVA